jgi:hypothetical protein
MKAMLIPVGCNEWLDFVRRGHGASPDPSLLIVSFNSNNAVWRFTPPQNQLSKAAQGSHHSSWSSTQEEL